MIVCLGWGSLIWAPRDLPVSDDGWRCDGPDLPIEFARQSADEHITLVIAEGSPLVPVLWASLCVGSLDDARGRLAKRERTGKKNIGYWSPTCSSSHCEANRIGQWAKAQGGDVDGVVWTRLRPMFCDKYEMPECEDVVGHLKKLEGEKRQNAEEYVRCAPNQIRTCYREAIESELGWEHEPGWTLVQPDDLPDK